MKDKLLIGVLGEQDSGKSTTWKTLFGANVRKSKNKRTLELLNDKKVEIFLVNDSPEESDESIKNTLNHIDAKIVLCSIQYVDRAKYTLDYFHKKGYDMYIQWLNPGYSEECSNPTFDCLGMVNQLISKGAFLTMRNGKDDPEERVEEIRYFIHGWATAWELI